MTALGSNLGGSPRPALSSGLSRYLEVLREQAKLIIACIVIALAVAIAYTQLAPKTYTAEAQMLVAPVDASNTTLFNLPVLHSSGDPTADVLTAASVVSTPAVGDAAARILHLHEAGSQLLGNVQVTPVGQSNLIAIQTTSSSPEQAAKLANAVVSAVVGTRAAALHAAVSALIPGLANQVAALPASQRNVPGSLGAELAQLQQLKASKDPTLTPSAAATVPTSPTSPKKTLSVVAGLVAGLLLGIGAAFAVHVLDPRLRRDEQLKAIFEAPILARIPQEPGKKINKPMLLTGMSAGAQEGYRTLRTIVSSHRGADAGRSLLITGSSPSEGKTTTAIALAVSLVQTGARVILIEADFRRPTICTALNIRPRHGTEDVLTGRVTLRSALTVTRVNGVPVGLLAVLQPQIELADRLSFSVAEKIIGEASKIADFVIIDSPPLTAVIDALPMAQVADEVLVVTRIGASKLNKLMELRNLLLEQGVSPSGLLLIGDSVSRSDAYYPIQRPVSSNGHSEAPPHLRAGDVGRGL
jgi:succinoglycan biosynthesis transport protein ExoP